MLASLLRACISITSTVFSLFTSSEEPGEGMSSRELRNIFILAVETRFSKIATVLVSCPKYSIS